MSASVAEPGGNLKWLGLIQVFRIASGAAISVMLMRFLGVESFGVYGYVTTLVAMLSFGSNLGLDRLIKREIARDEGTAGLNVATALAVSAGSAALAWAAIVAWAAAADGRETVVTGAAFAAFALGIQALVLVLNAYFHAVRRMGLAVWGSFAGRVTLVVATIFCLWEGLGVRAVFLAQVLDAVVALSVSWWVFRRNAPRVRLQTSGPDLRAMSTAAVPFGLNAFFGSVYLAADVLLLAYFHDDAEVGTYRGAVALISLFPLVAETLTNGVFPRMARHLGEPAAAGTELRFLARVLLAISVPAAVGGILTADGLMSFIGGAEFARSALPFAIMAPLLPLRFLNNALGMTLTALNRQSDRTRGVFMAASFNICANILVLPQYGAAGAAATTLLTEMLLLAWNGWKSRSVAQGLGLFGSGLRVGAAAVAMALVVVLVPGWHVLFRVALGAVTFAVAARFTGALRLADLRKLRAV